jgi:hypothetical protein
MKPSIVNAPPMPRPKVVLRALFAVINANCFAGTQSSISAMAVRGLEIFRHDPAGRCERWSTRLWSSQLSESRSRRFVRKTSRSGARILARCSFPIAIQVAGNLQFYSQCWSRKRNTLSAYTELPR